MTKKKTKSVALMFPINKMHEVQMLRGVADYAAECGTWRLDVNPELTTMSLRTLNGWSGDGVLSPLRTQTQLQAAKSLRVPIVNLAGTIRHTGLPRVMVDQEAVGRLAAAELLRCGFRRLAYFGQQDKWFSQQRRQGFVEQVERAGGQCSVFEAPSNSDGRQPWYRWSDSLQQWLKTLKLPIGLMAVHDYWARTLLDVCLRLGLRVPHDVALIGVDNDEIACEFCEVPLSSVARNGRREGYEAAALLDRLMAGKRPPKNDFLIAPEGVIKRLSTDVDAIENPHVAAAVRHIREHLDENFGVEGLEGRFAISRRYLYYHFRKCLGCTPFEYISRARIERAKQLLTAPKRLQLQEIAKQCGFSETRRLRIVFQRLTGVSPAEFRRSHLMRPQDSDQAR